MSDMVKEINDHNFDQDVLGSQKPVLVDFWAPWCGPCKALGPLVDALAQQYNGRMVFTKLNIDENPKTAGLYGIKAIPTIALFKDGKLFETIVGLTTRGKLEKAINNVLSDAAVPNAFVVN